MTWRAYIQGNGYGQEASSEAGSNDTDSTDTDTTEETTQLGESGEEETTIDPGKDSFITIGPSDGDADSENATGDESGTDKKKDNKDKEDGGLPWGVIFVVSALITVIAVVGVVIYRRKIVLCKEKQNTENQAT